ncbi:LacI family transcriptional regulator [Opitutaceae bacterium TAV5]|nr:LacI family transcriptional regulator [Opitutaceae bacterium TAV5]
MKPPTLHDVAREAGVSHMTVSRVVRGSRAVRLATAQQVRDVIARLGYRPDPALSALAAYRQRGGGAARGSTLVFIDCDGTAFTRDVWAGAREEAALDGYACEQVPLPPSPAAQRRLGRVLFHRGVRGLLFGPSEHPQEFTGWAWPEFAAVSLGALTHRPALHAVAMDYFHGAFSGCERLFANGCRRLGLVVDPHLESRTGGTWLGGYAAAVLPRHAPLICPDGARGDPSRLQAWLRRHRIDGVLTIHPEIAKVLRTRGLAAAFLNSGGAALHSFPYYALQPAEIGRHGVRLLHPAVLRREFGLPAAPQRVSLRGTWIDPAEDSG